MKLTLATSLLLASIPAVVSFTCRLPSALEGIAAGTTVGYSAPGRPTVTGTSTIRPRVDTKLQYQEDQTPDVHVDAVVDMGAVVSGLSVDDEAHLVPSLAFSLGMDDEYLSDQYHAWAKKYNKNASSSRFFNWKRNFLMQEVWNRTNGETFDLNEFGDWEKQEFDDKFSNMKTAALTGEGDNDSFISVPEITDASHAFHFEEHQPQPLLNTTPKPRKFKQVRTFSGGYRLVPCTDTETELTYPNSSATSITTKPKATTAFVGTGASTNPSATTPPSRDRQHFRKVALLKTRH